MAVIINPKSEPGAVFAGYLSQIELGMIRAAYLGPDDVLVVQVPIDLDDQGYSRLQCELKTKLPDRRVVLVGPGVAFGVLNTAPCSKISPTADLKDKIAEAERILRVTVDSLQRALEFAEAEIARLGLVTVAAEVGRIRVVIEGGGNEA